MPALLRALSTATTNKHPMHAAFKYHEFALSLLKSYYHVLIMAKHNFMRCPLRTDPPPNGVTPLYGPLRYVCNFCKSYAVRMRCARDLLRPARPAGAHPAARRAPAASRSRPPVRLPSSASASSARAAPSCRASRRRTCRAAIASHQQSAHGSMRARGHAGRGK